MKSPKPTQNDLGGNTTNPPSNKKDVLQFDCINSETSFIAQELFAMTYSKLRLRIQLPIALIALTIAILVCVSGIPGFWKFLICGLICVGVLTIFINKSTVRTTGGIRMFRWPFDVFEKNQDTAKKALSLPIVSTTQITPFRHFTYTVWPHRIAGYDISNLYPLINILLFVISIPTLLLGVMFIIISIIVCTDFGSSDVHPFFVGLFGVLLLLPSLYCCILAVKLRLQAVSIEGVGGQKFLMIMHKDKAVQFFNDIKNALTQEVA